MKGEQAMEFFKLIVQKNILPKKMEDLVPMSFIGQAAVEFARSKIKLMEKLGMAENQRKATLKDGQDAGELLLDIESRIGKLVKDEPDAIPDREVTNGKFKKPSGKPPKHERLGLSERQMRQAFHIAENPEIVEKIKKKAIENDDIPTKTAVLSEIKYQKEKERREKAEGNRKKMRIEVDIDQANYLSCLDQVLLILPTKPPKEWNDQALKEAKTKAKIIIKRLEVFI